MTTWNTITLTGRRQYELVKRLTKGQRYALRAFGEVEGEAIRAWLGDTLLGDMKDGILLFRVEEVSLDDYVYIEPLRPGVTINALKLEIGNQPGDWGSSEEDRDNQFSEVDVKFTNLIDGVVLTMSSLDGRVSENYQTIDGFSTTVSDLKGDVSRQEQTIKGFNTTVSTIDGRVTRAEQTVEEFKSVVSGLDGRVSNAEQTVNGFRTTVSGLDGRVTNVEQTTRGLQSTVANKADQSQITQLSNAISLRVTTATHNSAISQLSSNINLKVSKGDVLSQINVDADRVLIETNRLVISAPSTTFKGTAFIDGAVIQNATMDGAKIKDATIGTAKIANLDANKITGNTTSFVRSAWNAGSDTVTLDASGMYMTGSGSWRRSYLTATGFDLYNGQGGSGKAGAIGYFKEHANSSTSSENYIHATRGSNHYVGMGANRNHELVLGYTQYTTTANGYYRALTVNGTDGSIRIFRDLYPGASNYKVSYTAYDGNGLFGAGFTSPNAGIVFSSNGTWIWDEVNRKWGKFIS